MMMKPVLYKPSDLPGMISDGSVWPGDGVLVCGKVEKLRWFISRAQRRMIRDLDSDVSREDSVRLSSFTHTTACLDCVRLGEAWRPRYRDRHWMQLPESARLMVVRPKGATRADMHLVAEACQQDIWNGARYDTGELIKFYLWSWGFRKLFLGRRFAAIFDDGTEYTCGSAWATWCRSAGLLLDLQPSEMYPAREAYEALRPHGKFVQVAA